MPVEIKLSNGCATMRRRILRTACAALICGLSTTAVAQDKYPAKTIQLVVPFAPGGSTDIIARQLATRMEAQLGRSIVVENRSGASGTIGGAYVAQSAPDGYTVLLDLIRSSPPAAWRMWRMTAPVILPRSVS